MLFFINVFLIVITSLLFIICLFFLFECAAALLPRTLNCKVDYQNQKVAILVPAHNEEIVIASTLEKLTKQLKDNDRLIVIADNCTDATAKIARTIGATVIERQDVNLRGKGYALDYGLQFLETNPPDVVVFIDADCTVASDAIYQLTARATATGRPVQASYLMVKPLDSQSSKDIVSQFANIVKNLVRPYGLARFQQSCPLLGTGMAFPWSVIRACNVANGHLSEDLKLGLDLTIAGHKPLFCPEAKVTAYLPSSLQAVKTQRTRWVHGHLQLIQTYVPILFKEAIYQKRWDMLVSILDLCIPPLSLLVMIWLTLMITSSIVGVLTASWIPSVVSAAAGFCFITAVFIAWGKFARSYLPLQKLLTIPFYVLWKIPVYLQFLIKPQSTWVRTERSKTT
jgi:cellulose synthase/poly-beta-1,6-N-acetylglucosamine synthase-like glycosyltransferase